MKKKSTSCPGPQLLMSSMAGKRYPVGIIGTIISTCTLVCILFLGLARAETVDRIVAVVNDDIILYSELQEQAGVLEKMNPNINLSDPQSRSRFEREVLQSMVQERLAEQEIQRLKINVGKHDIDAAVAGFKRENGFTDDQLKYVLQQQGKTLDEFRDNIKKQLERARLIERVLKSKTVVTDEQVDGYLKSHPMTSDMSERRHLAVIFLPIPDSSRAGQVESLAGEIHKKLKAGEDFGKLARQYSQGPAPEDGGDIGFIAVGDMAPAIASATRGLTANQFTAPMKTPQGYYIIKVVAVDSKPQKVDGSMSRDKARGLLLQEQIDKKYSQWISDLTEKSFIQINY